MPRIYGTARKAPQEYCPGINMQAKVDYRADDPFGPCPHCENLAPVRKDGTVGSHKVSRTKLIHIGRKHS